MMIDEDILAPDPVIAGWTARLEGIQYSLEMEMGQHKVSICFLVKSSQRNLFSAGRLAGGTSRRQVATGTETGPSGRTATHGTSDS